MHKVKYFVGEYSALAAFIILFFLAFALKGFTFLSRSNITNILLNNSIIGIIALGMTMIIITGGIDLSVGSQLMVAGLAALMVINATGSILLGLVVAIVVGAATGLMAGALVAKCRIPAFIVTLGAMYIYRSVGEDLQNGGGIMVKGASSQAFIAISNTRLFGWLPLPIIYWLALSMIVYLFMSRTCTGRHIYAVGSNEKASLLSSINVNRVHFTVYILSGVLVALAAIVEGSRLGSIDSVSSGTSYEMDAIAAVVIGGTGLSGGRGKIFGTIMGTLTLGVINNMMNLLGVPPFLVDAVKGIVIIAAVLLQRQLDKSDAA